MKKSKAFKMLSVIGLGVVLVGCGTGGNDSNDTGVKSVDRKGELITFYGGVKLGDSIVDVKKEVKTLEGKKGFDVLTRKSEFTEVKAKDGSSVYLRYDKDGDTIEKSLLYPDKKNNVTGLLNTLSKKNTDDLGEYDALYKVKYETPKNTVDAKGNLIEESKDAKSKEVKGEKASYNERYEWREADRLVSVYTSRMGDSVRVFEGELVTAPAPIIVNPESKEKK